VPRPGLITAWIAYLTFPMKRPPSSCARVESGSMIGAGIHDGDEIAIDLVMAACESRIVVAIVTASRVLALGKGRELSKPAPIAAKVLKLRALRGRKTSQPQKLRLDSGGCSPQLTALRPVFPANREPISEFSQFTPKSGSMRSPRAPNHLRSAPFSLDVLTGKHAGNGFIRTESRLLISTFD